MKKIVLTILVVSYLFSIPNAVYAQNTFSCEVINFNGTDQCFTDLSGSSCDPGYQAKFADGTSCADVSVAECNSRVGPYPCLLPPPTCLPPNTCQRGGCANGAVQIPGLTCNDKESVCCPLNSQDCYTDCMNDPLSTPSECKASCGLTNGGGDEDGDGGTTPTGGGLIDLNALIDNMGSSRFNSTSTLGLIFTIALPFLYTIAGISLLFYLIIGGFRYLTSQGDPKKLEGAKGSITMAIVGFIIVITAYFLTQIVNYVFRLGVGI